MVNAATTLTALGGTTLPVEVVEAMAAAAQSCVSMEELHLAAGRRAATLTNNESALVTSGAAAALALAVLAAVSLRRTAALDGIAGGASSSIDNRWSGWVARSGTPQPVLDRLNQALAAALASDEVRRRFAALGAVEFGKDEEPEPEPAKMKRFLWFCCGGLKGMFRISEPF